MNPKILKLLGAAGVLVLQLALSGTACAVEPDKVAHFGGATALGIAVDSTLYHLSTEMGPGQRMAASAGLALIPGLGIEIADEFSGHNYFSWSDFSADILGAVTGAVFSDLVNGQFWIAASGKQIRLIGHW